MLISRTVNGLPVNRNGTTAVKRILVIGRRILTILCYGSYDLKHRTRRLYSLRGAIVKHRASLRRQTAPVLFDRIGIIVRF